MKETSKRATSTHLGRSPYSAVFQRALRYVNTTAGIHTYIDAYIQSHGGVEGAAQSEKFKPVNIESYVAKTYHVGNVCQNTYSLNFG